MRKFKQYVALRESESIPSGRKTDKSIIPYLEKLMRILWDRHHEDTREFVSNIARKDPEVKELLDRADRIKEPELDTKPHDVPDEMNPNVAQVVPPRSDMAAGMDQ